MVNMEEHNGKHDFQVCDWSKIQFMVKCEWSSWNPLPDIEEFYFESFGDVQGFATWYNDINKEGSNKIIMIAKISEFFIVESYEVTTKVRVVSMGNKIKA